MAQVVFCGKRLGSKGQLNLLAKCVSSLKFYTSFWGMENQIGSCRSSISSAYNFCLTGTPMICIIFGFLLQQDGFK